MPQTYSHDDPVSGRWVGVGRPLTYLEADDNFYTLIQRVTTLENDTVSNVGIAFITLTGNELTFTMTDHTTRGPFTIPPATFRGRGAWTASTSYSVNDTVTNNGSLYLVIFPHTSALTFDPGANDGIGDDYYSLMLMLPGNVLPTGGAVGMYLKKSDGHDFDVTWAYPIPVGGTTGQVLAKVNGTDFNTAWTGGGALGFVTAPPPSPPGTPGQVLSTVDGTAGDTAWINFTGGTLASDTDVAITSPQQYDHLEFNGTQWANVQRGEVDIGTVSGSHAIDPLSGSIYTITPNGAVTITQASGAPAGMPVTLKIISSGTTSYDVTFGGSNIINSGDVFTGIVSGKIVTVSFVMDFAGNLCEVGRSIQVPSGATTLTTTGTVSLDPTLGDVFTMVPSGGVTLNATSAPLGKRVTLVVTTSGTSSFNITPTTNFKSQGALATGTVGAKVFTISFIGDGVNMNEVSRTTAM